jgi:hypothetical protein
LIFSEGLLVFLYFQIVKVEFQLYFLYNELQRSSTLDT